MTPPTFLVKKGTPVFSTSPGWPLEGRPAHRDYTVKVQSFDHTRVSWAGAGGYWKWVKREQDQ